jgi:hypothetical protein
MDSNCDHVGLWQYLDLCVYTKYWEEYPASIFIASSLLRMEAAFFLNDGIHMRDFTVSQEPWKAS